MNSALEAAPAGQRTTLEDALAQAKFLQRNEKLLEAEAIYGEILAQLPGEPNTLQFLGILRHQQGRADESIQLIEQAAQALPGEPGPWLNLGNVLLENARFEQAIECYSRAAELIPDFLLAWNNLGILHTRRQEWAAAEASFLRGLSVAPDASYLHHNYARMLYAAGRFRESAAHAMQSLELDPSSGTARKLLSISHSLLGESEKALRSLEEWRELEPDNPEVTHHLAACGAAEVPERASDAYVEHVFDKFALSFDQQLQTLGYRAPFLVRDAFAQMASHLGPNPCVLDAGCGTGLCGALLRPFAGSLHGVDLSGGMLERSRDRGIYDALERGELTAHLQSRSAAYDAVVSADTLCYFGALESFLAAARTALRSPGLLVFTLEASEDESSPYQLQVHGRYAHAQSYVSSAVQKAGFQLQRLESGILRSEFIEPVKGWIVVATPVPLSSPAFDIAPQTADRSCSV